ncbi:MAG: tetratricopeptide repeat protein [Oligoflexia bacterium]|nr:tetratricopeptide repeat protein [Oligoflexia bacterium]
MKSPLVLSLSLAVLLSGCLKSRLQIREDGDGPSKPVPAQIQEVPPQSHVVDELKNEITRLAGRLEDLERSKPDPNAAALQKEEIKKLEARIQELENAQIQLIEAMKKMHEAKPAAPAAADPGSFEKAKANFEAGNYDLAIEGLSGYLRSPKPPRAEEATYLRGEAYFITKQYKKAIVDFSRFPEKFSRSKRLPGALWKIGQSFESLGMKDDAKGFYQELIEKFPKAPETKKARAKLK